MRPLHLVLGMVLACVLGAAVAPLPPTERPLIGVRRDVWQPPSMPLRLDSSNRMVGILGASFWGAAAQAAEQPIAAPEDSRWRIAAIYRTSGDSGVLVEYGATGKAPQRLGLGDALPSGHRIVEIGERDVCVMVGKKKLRLGVERWNG